MKKTVNLLLLSLFSCMSIGAQPETPDVLAFPGAEGGGKYTTGGRGGDVLIVNSLADDGSEGTLRWAIRKKGARTIVFSVGGNIELTSPLPINNNDLTIAGQTAPGDGICVKGYPVRVNADNVIIRFMRFRMGDENNQEADALSGTNQKNIIIDHCSMSWSTDECASFYGNENFTMQWSIISESLSNSVHKKGQHGYGAIWGGKNASFHHNLMAHNASRNPRLDHPGIYTKVKMEDWRGDAEVNNNVIYNWNYNTTYGGEAGRFDMIGNYYKPGPASKLKGRFIDVYANASTFPKLYFEGNVMQGDDALSADNWLGVKNKNKVLDTERAEVRLSEPLFKSNMRVEPAKDAYRAVLDHAGASLRRDAIDTRVVNEVEAGTATYSGSMSKLPGIIDSQKDVGGWCTLNGGTPLTDSDADGMPDQWEIQMKLNPADKADGKQYTLNKNYTNLEIYLNDLVYKIIK